MVVQELMEMFVDADSQHIQLFDVDKEDVVFDGDYADIPDEYDNAEITSIDNVWNNCNGIFSINIETMKSI